MLPLPTFSLLHPERVDQALEMFQAHTQARYVAGGTDLLPSMKQGLFSPPTLISLERLSELRGVSVQDGLLRVGAMTSLAELAASPLVQQAAPGLVQAARGIATPTLQNMGTIGGNLLLDTRCRFYNQSVFWRGALGEGTQSGCLKCDPQGICHVAPKGTGCYAAHSADTVPTLMLLDAQVEIATPGQGRQRVSVSELYGPDGREGGADGRLQLPPGALLVALWLPQDQPATVHRKLRTRAAIDYALLIVAAGPQGVVVSAVGPQPQRITGVDQALADGDHEAVAEAASKQIQPLSTHIPPVPWRKKMVRVLVRRALEDLAGGT